MRPVEPESLRWMERVVAEIDELLNAEVNGTHVVPWSSTRIKLRHAAGSLRWQVRWERSIKQQ